MFQGRFLRLTSFSAGRRFTCAIRGVASQTVESNLPPAPQSFLLPRQGKGIYSGDEIQPDDLGPEHFLPSGEYDAKAIAMAKMHDLMNKSPFKRQRFEAARGRLSEGQPGEVLTFEANAILTRHRSKANRENGTAVSRSEQLTNNFAKPLAEFHLNPHTEMELEIEELSSTGEGLAYSEEHDHVFVVPFSVPGDRVRVKTYPQAPNNIYSTVDLLETMRLSPKREGVTPGCQYFGTCSGCQLQMLPYEDQLRHKKTIIEKAFRHFSNLEPSLIPPVGDTIGSPLQYGYRTKLTPHHPGPPGKNPSRWEKAPAIGFTKKNRMHVLDVEQCPIATPIINEGMKVERKKVHDTFRQRKSGVTILLRESTSRRVFTAAEQEALKNETTATEEEPREASKTSPETENTSPQTNGVEAPIKSQLRYRSADRPEIKITYPKHEDVKTYTSVHNADTVEYVGDFEFQNKANSFFQNNNSILPTFIDYVRDNCMSKPRTDASLTASSTPTAPEEPPIKYLLDAYCGSGLFTVCLSPLFSSALGIDIDSNGIAAARVNALENHLPNAGFIAADAGALFSDVPFPPEQTLVVIDPPRRGASVDFLQQLCKFGPRRVVYVSCNVHTQARDVGLLVQGFSSQWRYEIESLRGFDFFPQTGHVEGVCFLNRVRDAVGFETEENR